MEVMRRTVVRVCVYTICELHPFEADITLTRVGGVFHAGGLYRPVADALRTSSAQITKIVCSARGACR